jgi:hypothetical protein
VVVVLNKGVQVALERETVRGEREMETLLLKEVGFGLSSLEMVLLEDAVLGLSSLEEEGIAEMELLEMELLEISDMDETESSACGCPFFGMAVAKDLCHD